jgi:hypothetical protein
MAATAVSPNTRRAHVRRAHLQAPAQSRRPLAYRTAEALDSQGSRLDSTIEPIDAGVEIPAPEGRRDLRVVRPAPKRTSRLARRAVFIGPALVLGSLLSVAGAQAYLAQGQVRLSSLQADVAAAQTKRLDLELQIANEEQPSSVMAAARQLGLVVPSKISDLPAVALPGGTQSHTTHTTNPTKATNATNAKNPTRATNPTKQTRAAGATTGTPGAP